MKVLHLAAGFALGALLIGSNLLVSRFEAGCAEVRSLAETGRDAGNRRRYVTDDELAMQDTCVSRGLLDKAATRSTFLRPVQR